MPAECGAIPVSNAARLGEQVGAAENAWRNVTPDSASAWNAGMATGNPYGSVQRPVSCEWT